MRPVQDDASRGNLREACHRQLLFTVKRPEDVPGLVVNDGICGCGGIRNQLLGLRAARFGADQDGSDQETDAERAVEIFIHNLICCLGRSLEADAVSARFQRVFFAVRR